MHVCTHTRDAGLEGDAAAAEVGRAERVAVALEHLAAEDDAVLQRIFDDFGRGQGGA